jgi:DNA repair exonuclease SbcCD nuclease subunit
MKIIELADLHLDPKWIEAQKPCLHQIIETGEKEKPDFICIAGDIYNRPFYNSDKDSISLVRLFIKDLLEIAPVVMITGTPAHDAPGSYGIFEDLGCHVIKPNSPEIINDVLFIGLPEIDKISLMTKNKLSLKDADIHIMKSLNNFIKKYWVPVRESNKDKPCIFMGHGVFVDDIAKSKNNPIIKNSDFVIDNFLLQTINADRYIFGHFHTPEESKILNGGYVGYAGYDKTPWNNTGFQPGFNLTEIKRRYVERTDDYYYDTDIITNRIPYPVTQNLIYGK